MKRFANFPELSSELAYDLIERLAGNDRLSAEFGASNQSCSRYVNIDLWDDEGDHIEDFKVRFSDHDDRYGSDITIRIDDKIIVIEDDGEYVATEISEEDYEIALNEAADAVARFIAENA